jgi:HAD superfamily hydrolase (TIGR01509 family)
MTADTRSTDPRAAVRAVVFDLDGLLIDTEWVFTEAARRLLARRGLGLDAAFMAAIMGTPGRDALPRFRDRFGLSDPLDQLADEYKRFFFEALEADHAPLMPGAVELIDRLERRGLPKAIATSSSREYVDTVFGPHGLVERFAFVLTCEDVTHGKPHPEVYERAAARLGFAAAEVVVLEDSANGLRAAKAAGCRCVVVPHAHTPRDELTGADLIAPSLAAPDLWALFGA